MPEVKLSAELRTEFGKGAARRIRRAHKVPAVLYGHGTDPIHISLPGHETLLALRTNNALLSIDIDGKAQLALPKQVQRDPHPAHHRARGPRAGPPGREGHRRHRDLPRGRSRPGDPGRGRPEQRAIEAEATHIPTQIVVSIEGLRAGTQILASDLKLPEGSSLAIDPEALIVNITAAQSVEAAEAELAEAEAEAGIEPTVAESSRGRGAGRRAGARARERLIRSPRTLPCPRGWWSGWATPGPAYAGHRHNIGFRVVEELARRTNTRFSAPRGMRAEVGEARLGPPGPDSVRLILAKSRTFMNETGAAVSKLLGYFSLDPSRLIADPRRAGHRARPDPGQVRRRGQRPQRPAVDPAVARPRGLLPGPGRRRPTARPPGSGGLPAQQLPGQCPRCGGGRDRPGRRRRRVTGHRRAGAHPERLQLLSLRTRFSSSPRLYPLPVTLSGLVDLFCTEPTVSQAIADARDARTPALDLTSPAPMRPLIAAALTAAADRGGADRPILLVTSTFREAEELTSALECLVDPDAVAYYPAWETLPHERLSPRSDTVGRRLAVLRRLAGNAELPPPRIVVAPVRSVLQPQVKGLGELRPVRLVVGQDFDPMRSGRSPWSTRRTSGSIWSSGAVSSRCAAGSSTCSRPPKSIRSGSTSSATRSRRCTTSPSPTSAPATWP